MQNDYKNHMNMADPVYFTVENPEKYFRTIIESSFSGIAVTDEHGNFEYVNESFLKMVNWPREEIIGQNFIKIIPEDTHELALRLCNEVQRGINNNHEIKIKTRNGELKYVNSLHKLTEINGKLKTISITEDITVKKRLEQELKESEARYRELFENANDSIFTSDADGYILTANNTTVKLLGCNTKDEVIGTHFSDWLAPESIRNAQNNQRKYLSGEPVEQPVVHKFICKNGEHKWAEIRSRIIKEGDRAVALHCIARDVTEKIKLEQELKESEARYRELFENAIVPMYILDTEGNILKINKVGLQLLGCTEEEVTGTNMSKWLTPASLKIAQESQKKRFSGESRNHTDTVEFVCKNGEHRWAETTSRVIKDGDRIIGIHGIGKDLTENMRLKQALKKSDKQKNLLYYLLEGTRGGKTRALILKNLIGRSYNAHQLAKLLNMDYKTVRHHLEVLLRNGIITRCSDGYTDLYSLSKNIGSGLDEFNHELHATKS